jgi:hypothetical protein
VDGDRILRPPARGVGGGVAKGVHEPDGTAPLRSLPVESPSLSGRPPSGRCLWSHRARRGGHLSGHPRLPFHRRCHIQRLACTPCRVVEVLHHRAVAPAFAASAGSRAGLLSVVYHRSRRRCRPTSRPTETPAVVCRQCSSHPK